MLRSTLILALGAFLSLEAVGDMAKGLKFSTFGNDCWADGGDTNAVDAGECYALVWKKDGATFPGLPMVPPNPDDVYALGDDVWLVNYFPVAALNAATGRMRCPEQAIGIGSLPLEEEQSGTWTVYLLDTRHKLADGSVVCGFNESVTNAPWRINAYRAVPGLTDFKVGTTLGPAWEEKVGGSEDGTPVVADVLTVATKYVVEFDPMGGECEEQSRTLAYGDAYGVLPEPRKTGSAFRGWFTAAEGGEEVKASNLALGDATAFARWVKLETPVLVLGEPANIDVGKMLGIDLKGYAAKDLPKGLKFKDGVITGTAGGVTGPEGVEVTFTKANARTYALTMVVAGLPDWAVGEFAGVATSADESTHGTAAFKVEASGKISGGKIVLGATTWAFSAPSFDSLTDEPEETCVLVATAKSRGLPDKTLRLEVAGRGMAAAAEKAALASGSFGFFDESGDWVPEEEGFAFELWRNVWKDADAASLLASIAGKYTWAYGDGEEDVEPLIPMTLDAKSAAFKGAAKLAERKGAKVTLTATAFASTNGLEAVVYVAPDANKSFDEIYRRVAIVPSAGDPELGVARRDPGVIAYALLDGDGQLGKRSAATVNPAGGQVEKDKAVTLTAKADSADVFYRWVLVKRDGTVPNEQIDIWLAEGDVVSLAAHGTVDAHEKAAYVMDGRSDVLAIAQFRAKASCTQPPKFALGDDIRKAFGKMELGVAFSAAIDVDESTKPVQFSAKSLPTGLKIDKETGVISGVPTANAKGVIEITATSKVNKSLTTTIKLDAKEFGFDVSAAALPTAAVGTFSGFVVGGTDADGCDLNVGSVTFTASEVGKLSAKVVTASGSYSFSAGGWDSSVGGVYAASLAAKGSALNLRLDANAPWNENQLSGDLVVNGASRPISAQRNVFGQPWCFHAEGDEERGWTLSYTNAVKNAPLTVTLKLDGTTTVAGTLNGTPVNNKAVTYKVSASGYANMCMVTNGAFVADFAPVVKLHGTNTTLSVRTHLWLDRKGEPGRFVGDAKFVW